MLKRFVSKNIINFLCTHYNLIISTRILRIKIFYKEMFLTERRLKYDFEKEICKIKFFALV